MTDDKYDRRDFLTIAGAAALGGIGGAAHGQPPSSTDDLCFLPAAKLAALVRARTVSAREVMAAHLARIARVNPKLNAIVAKLDDDQCLALADAAEATRFGKRRPNI